MKRYALLGALVTALLAYGGAANATTITDTGYTVADVNASTGPTIGSLLTINSFAMPAQLATKSTTKNFFTLSPKNGPLKLGSDGKTYFQNCPTGTGCVGTTETTTVNVALGSITVNGLTGGPYTANVGTLTGVFTAQYDPTLPALGCSLGDGGPNPGQSDCFIWTGAPNTHNGSIEKTYSIGGGYQLDLFLYNASDWSITPTVAFEVEDAPVNTPEPGTLALLSFGLLGTLTVARRRRG